jgi:two-component system response regulator
MDMIIDNPFVSDSGICRSNLQVLLVEDSEADAYLVRRALARIVKIGVVVIAKDGIEALELIDNDAIEPDLAIIDLRMPRMDGLGLLRAFSKRESVQFPTIVLTTSTCGADILRSWKRGAVEFVNKRNSVDEMTAALDHVISNVL